MRTAPRPAAATRTPALIALGLATVAVSVSAVLIQEARTDAATVVWLRMALAVLLLAPWSLPRLRGGWASGRADAALTLTAGLLLAAHFLLWTASLAYTSVAASVLLVSLHPLLVAPAGAWFVGDRLHLRTGAGILLGLAGTVITCAGGLGGGSGVVGGDLLAVGGAVALAGYLLIGRRRRARGGVLVYSSVAYAVVAVCAVLAALAAHTVHLPSTRALVACAGLAAVCTIGGHTVFNWTLQRLPASLVSLSFLGEPPLAALLALLVLGQVPAATTVLGGLLILAGLALAVTGTGAGVGADAIAG